MFGEILPKAIALKAGPAVIHATAPFLLFVRAVLMPFIIVFRRINRVLLKWNYFFVLSVPHPFITSEEYVSALERASSNGDVSVDAGVFLRDMGEISGFPLSRIVIYRAFLLEEGSSYSVDLTEAGTVASVKDNRSGLLISDISWFSLSRTIGDLMKYFLETEKRIALVHDEYGEYYGIATVDSLYEYLRNLHRDENERPRSIEVYGGEPVARYLNWFDQEMLDRFPEIQSVGGILVAWFETIPVKGDVFESELYIFEILHAEKNSVGKLKITRK